MTDHDSFDQDCEKFWKARDRRDLKLRRMRAEKNPKEHRKQLGWCGLNEQWWRGQMGSQS